MLKSLSQLSYSSAVLFLKKSFVLCTTSYILRYCYTCIALHLVVLSTQTRFLAASKVNTEGSSSIQTDASGYDRTYRRLYCHIYRLSYEPFCCHLPTKLIIPPA